MSEGQRREHVDRFRNFEQTPTGLYKQSTNVGRKPGDKVRKRSFVQPIFVEERIEVSKCPRLTVTKKNDTYSSRLEDDFDLSKLDPKGKNEKELFLRLKSTHKMVTR